MKPRTGTADIFVGRQEEMAVLETALNDAMSGQGRLVMLAGEPGIGKTRTAQQLASRAEALGASVLWGWCYEEAGAPSFWPWVQPIRSYVQRTDPEKLRHEMGRGAADIAEIIPEVRDILPGLETPAVLEPEQARFRLFDSISTLLTNASESQPLVLVLDDLHWADQPSLLFLQFLERQIAGSRLLVVGCYRDMELPRQHPLSDTLAQLSRSSHFQRAILRGLSREETARFIEEVDGTSPTDGLIETVFTHTEGNPFFVAEVIKLLSDEGTLTTGDSGESPLRIPAGVREVIGQRLNKLSADCNQTLTIASVVGPQFDLKTLHSLSNNSDEDRLLKVIDEALEARLIEEISGRVDRYRFTHALIQETLAGEMSTTRRVRLHVQIGDALEDVYGLDVETHAAELAHHFAEAEVVVGTEKLVHYSSLAGERALATYAYEEALAHYQRALNAKEGQPMDAGTAALLFGLGRAHAAMIQRGEAVANLSHAFDYYAEAGDVARAVVVAEYPISPGVGRMRVNQLIARGLALVPPESHEAGTLLSRYGLSLSNEMGDYNGAQEAFDKALTIARREGDVALEMSVLANSANVDFLHLRWQDCVEKGLRAVELSHSDNGDDPQVEVTARFWLGLALAYAGDLGGAQQQQTAALSRAEELRHRGLLAIVLLGKGVVSQLEGDWQAARTFSDQGLAVATQDSRLLCVRVMLEYEAGELGEGEVYLEQLLEVMNRTTSGPTFEYGLIAFVLPIVARITGVTDRLHIAEAAAGAVLASPSAIPLFAMWARGGLALLAVLQGDAVAATEQYNALGSARGMVFPGSTMVRDRLLGLLAHTIGNLDKAVEHFEDALTFCRKASYRPELAWTCYDYADALVGRNSPSDRERATALLEESLTIASELGMRPLKERVAALQQQVESLASRAAEYPDGLTRREVEVLKLVAMGKTDREIAVELFLSVATVHTHMRNLLSKTNSANRTEAAAYAARHGLL